MIDAMSETLRHRGPDDAGTWFSEDRRVGLAHRRLSIIDLSPGGRQPMSDSRGRLHITFNGEIYNYILLRQDLEGRGCRFRTASDTEVILEAYREWGTDCLGRMNGMFAFCLYDEDSRRLFLARDRAGEKPLFYRYSEGKLVFASELKALMVDSDFCRELDLDSLEHYLAYGYVGTESCILKGVQKLPPAHAMIYDLEKDELRSWAYWNFPTGPADERMDPRDLLNELESLLLDSVRMRLVADVPVGILLSGGIDSSLVTAMAAQVSSTPVKTFTITFPGHGSYDEGPHARLVARHFGTEHKELVAEPASLELLPKLARQFDEPVGDHSIIPTYIVSRLIREHAKVALGGDGGDELFGGYPHYSILLRLEQVRRFIPASVRWVVEKMATAILPVGTRGRNHLAGLGGELSRSFSHINLYFDERSRRRLIAPLATGGKRLNGPTPERKKEEMCFPGESVLRQAARLDFETTLPNDYLVKIDRASMLASLEIRAPFLDHRLVEFAFRQVPDSLRVDLRERKVLLRRLARQLLPERLDLNRKQGFELPLNSWFRGEAGTYIQSVLNEADPCLFDRRFLRELIAGQRKGYANAKRLFLLTVFELWRREYKIALPS